MLTRVAPSILTVVVAVSVIGRARGDSDSKALATELFAQGIKQLEAGKCDEREISDRSACEQAREHFQRAYEIYPEGLGALRNLAYVERGLGRYASAARRFRELQQRAPTDPNPKRHVWAEYAAKELAVIEPLVPHLTVEPPVDRPEGMTIVIDGRPIPQPAWGTALEIDPGTHKVRAEAVSVAPFERDVTLAEKEAQTVAIKFKRVEPPANKPAPKPAEGKATTGSSRVPPLIVVGVGAATLITGLGFGYAAINARQEACGDGKLCEREGLDDARSYAATANVLTGLGAAALVGGAAWFFLAPKPGSNNTGVHFVPFAGGGAIVGQFQ